MPSPKRSTSPQATSEDSLKALDPYRPIREVDMLLTLDSDAIDLQQEMIRMADYILFMHNDAATDDPTARDPYLQALRQKGVFEGGSEIGCGICVRKGAAAPPVTKHLSGYIRIAAATLEDAKALLAGNPHFEAGGTVEIRELPPT